MGVIKRWVAPVPDGQLVGPRSAGSSRVANRIPDRWIDEPMDLRGGQPRPARAGSLGYAAGFLAGLSLLLALPAQAARYDAICGRQRCRIEITDQGVKGPAGVIPADRIVQWNAVGWKNHSALVSSLGATGGALTGTAVGAVATCWTLIACPFGILAGAVVGGVAGSRAGKSADYRFSVEGYDVSGQPVTHSFRFINAQPVPGLVDNLTKVSGLEMAVRRDVAIAAPPPRRSLPPSRPVPPRRPSGASRFSPPPPARTSTQPSPATRPDSRPDALPPPLLLPREPAAVQIPERGVDALPPGPGGESEMSEMPILYDAIDPYQGTPLFP